MMYLCPNTGILFLSLIANSVDPDEMSPCVAFHLGLHCLPKYLVTFFQNEKGQKKGNK